jgi:hypothetical protein
VTPEDDVRARVREVARGRAGGMGIDPEEAHGLEDALWSDVLRAIAEGAENPRELAAEALTTEDIAFPRWYA